MPGDVATPHRDERLHERIRHPRAEHQSERVHQRTIMDRQPVELRHPEAGEGNDHPRADGKASHPAVPPHRASAQSGHELKSTRHHENHCADDVQNHWHRRRHKPHVFRSSLHAVCQRHEANRSRRHGHRRQQDHREGDAPSAPQTTIRHTVRLPSGIAEREDPTMPPHIPCGLYASPDGHSRTIWIRPVSARVRPCPHPGTAGGGLPAASWERLHPSRPTRPHCKTCQAMPVDRGSRSGNPLHRIR